MKARASQDNFLTVLQYCERIVDAETIEQCRKLSESGDLTGAAENLYEQLSNANSPLPPAYWKTIAACTGKSLEELVDLESAYLDEEK